MAFALMSNTKMSNSRSAVIILIKLMGVFVHIF